MTSGAWARTSIGSYQLGELVGAGGMGEVYRAVHTPTGRTVAVKVLTAASGAPTVAERFRNEARVQAAMSHPNIATLHELLEFHGTPCIVMEFVDGETLEQLLRRRGALPATEALALAARVAGAVGYLHGRGVIHRDIKTSNVKLDSAGTVKLLDFGIAKGPDSPALTRTGNVIGTLQSLAPEQLERGHCDTRTDIWALGVLLHELLTARHPFAEQGTFGITDRIRAGRYRAPSKVNPRLPSGVDRVVARCLRVDPAQRYQSCEEVLDDVRALLEPRPQPPASTGLGIPGAMAPEVLALVRSRGRMSAAIAGGVLAAAALGWLALGQPRPGGGAMGDDTWTRAEVLADRAGLQAADLPGALPSSQAATGMVAADGGAADRPPVGGTAASGTAASGTAASGAAASGATDGDRPLREVTVNALNGVADVYQDGRYVGRTPYQLHERVGTPVSLVLRRPGYEDAPVVFDVTEGRRSYSITLRRREPGRDGGARQPVPPAPSSPTPPGAAGWLGLPFLGWRRRSRWCGDGGAEGNEDAGVTGEAAAGGAAGGARDGADDVPGEAEMLIGIVSDTGCVRDGNEDSVRVVRPAGVDALSRRGLLAVVCDGMGGHAAGETASRLAADVVARLYAVDATDPGVALARAVKRANRAVHDAARGDARLAGMGTTCTAVVLRGGRAWCAHVGDSRCYLLRGEQIYLMTEDHSAVMELVRRRSISREEARSHPDRNVVSRAIGSHRDVDVSVWARPFTMRPGDRLLLSSDGLHDLLEEEEIRRIALAHAPQEACRGLVQLARERGAPDNVSVILLELPERRPPAVAVGATRELLAVAEEGDSHGGGHAG